MAKAQTEGEIRELAGRVAEAAGVLLYDLELGRKGPRWVLTIYIDRPGDSVTLADGSRDLIWTDATPPDLTMLAIIFAVGMVLLVIGTLIFKRLEPAFAKVL